MVNRELFPRLKLSFFVNPRFHIVFFSLYPNIHFRNLPNKAYAKYLSFHLGAYPKSPKKPEPYNNAKQLFALCLAVLF